MLFVALSCYILLNVLDSYKETGLNTTEFVVLFLAEAFMYAALIIGLAGGLNVILR
jgi:uncharacterized ion transporter superfamily protein YfcC